MPISSRLSPSATFNHPSNSSRNNAPNSLASPRFPPADCRATARLGRYCRLDAAILERSAHEHAVCRRHSEHAAPQSGPAHDLKRNTSPRILKSASTSLRVPCEPHITTYNTTHNTTTHCTGARKQKRNLTRRKTAITATMLHFAAFSSGIQNE